MPTAVASAVAPSIAHSHVQQDLSPKSSHPNLASHADPVPDSAERRSPTSTHHAPAASDGGAGGSSPDAKRNSPNSLRSGIPPTIVVKKEPPSPPTHSAGVRHRPRKLDLNASIPSKISAGLPSKPSGSLTARESGSRMQDVGLACLSPGFQTQDPTMQQQVQRSYSVRDRQRHIIESRLQKSAKATEGDLGRGDAHGGGSGLKTPMSSKKRPNPGLSIVPPSHEQFANERVIQSAPLHQTFTGRHQPLPLTRHIVNNQAHHAEHSHLHHMPQPQTANRLPPIGDVFANEGIGVGREQQPNGIRPPAPPYSQNPPPNPPPPSARHGFPSPGLPPGPTSVGPPPPRPREYRSAEEAVAELTSGREDLLPKLVHYGGHQPPTPPSPSAQQPGLTPNKHLAMHAEPSRGIGRRRVRSEYERDAGSPPLGSGPSPRRAPFGEGRDSPETIRRKKEEFLGLCSRAWDLFHN